MTGEAECMDFDVGIEGLLNWFLSELGLQPIICQEVFSVMISEAIMSTFIRNCSTHLRYGE